MSALEKRPGLWSDQPMRWMWLLGAALGLVLFAPLARAGGNAELKEQVKQDMYLPEHELLTKYNEFLEPYWIEGQPLWNKIVERRNEDPSGEKKSGRKSLVTYAQPFIVLDHVRLNFKPLALELENLWEEFRRLPEDLDPANRDAIEARLAATELALARKASSNESPQALEESAKIWREELRPLIAGKIAGGRKAVLGQIYVYFGILKNEGGSNHFFRLIEWMTRRESQLSKPQPLVVRRTFRNGSRIEDKSAENVRLENPLRQALEAHPESRPPKSGVTALETSQSLDQKIRELTASLEDKTLPALFVQLIHDLADLLSQALPRTELERKLTLWRDRAASRAGHASGMAYLKFESLLDKVVGEVLTLSHQQDPRELLLPVVKAHDRIMLESSIQKLSSKVDSELRRVSTPAQQQLVWPSLKRDLWAMIEGTSAYWDSRPASPLGKNVWKERLKSAIERAMALAATPVDFQQRLEELLSTELESDSSRTKRARNKHALALDGPTPSASDTTRRTEHQGEPTTIKVHKRNDSVSATRSLVGLGNTRRRRDKLLLGTSAHHPAHRDPHWGSFFRGGKLR